MASKHMVLGISGEFAEWLKSQPGAPTLEQLQALQVDYRKSKAPPSIYAKYPTPDLLVLRDRLDERRKRINAELAQRS